MYGRILTVCIGVIILTTFLWTSFHLFSAINYRNPTTNLVYVEKGDSTRKIATNLEEAGVINSKCVFRAMAKLKILEGFKLMPGEYEFPANTSMVTALNKIITGERYIRRITIPEGYTAFQIEAMVNEAFGLVQHSPLQINENEIMPDTYHYYYGDSNKIIEKNMKDELASFVSKNPIPAGHLLKNYNEVLTLASIVEKETSIAEERPVVAAVFLNRLKIGMPLQADPTVIYGMFAGKTDYNYQLKSEDMKFDSKYNTYVYQGLPPSPIATSSRGSILAVFNPANVDYLYFVADGKGGHNFAKDLKTHNQNIAQLRLTR